MSLNGPDTSVMELTLDGSQTEIKGLFLPANGAGRRTFPPESASDGSLASVLPRRSVATETPAAPVQIFVTVPDCPVPAICLPSADQARRSTAFEPRDRPPVNMFGRRVPITEAGNENIVVGLKSQAADTASVELTRLFDGAAARL